MSETRSEETVTRLKQLLFDRESRELDALRARLADVYQRAGSDEQFQRTVAEVLDRAMRDAETARHRELADAMAPMVLRTLRTEVRSRHMQDQLADTLFPRIGDMVSRYVASAIRDLMQEINRRLEGGLAHNRMVLWLRSLSSGRSMAELALADTQRLDIVDIYLVRRGAGTLVHHWRGPGDGDAAAGANRDALVSGFLAAITSFAEDAFEADRESLRTLDLDDHRIYLRGSPDHLLAVRCRGTAPAGIDRDLDAALLRILAENQSIEAAEGDGEGAEAARGARREALLSDAAREIETAALGRARELSSAHGSGTLKVLAWLIALPLAAFLAWYLYVSWVTSSLQSRASAELASISAIKGYPVQAHVERGAHRIWVTGLVPDEIARAEVLGRLKALDRGAELSEAIGVLPRADLDARLGAEGLRRSLDRAQRRLAGLAVELSAARAKAGDTRNADLLASAESAVRAALADLEPTATTADPAAAVLKAVASVRTAAGRLAAAVGADPAAADRAPQDAVEAAEALALASDRIARLVAALEQRQVVEPIARGLDAVGRELAARTADVERDAAARVAGLDERLSSRLAELERSLAGLSPVPPTPRQRLALVARESALFFANDADYRDPGAAIAFLDRLAALLTEAAVPVRLVGYTDEAGTPARNSQIAQARADRVAADLIARGVPRELLVAVGRGTSLGLAPGSGADSPNRRVEVELTFEGERGARP